MTTKKLIVRQRLNELKNPSEQVSGNSRSDIKVLDILLELSEKVTEMYDFDVNTLVIKNNNEITITATTDNYQTVDRIANALKGSDLFRKIDAGNADPSRDRIKFDLKLEVTE